MASERPGRWVCRILALPLVLAAGQALGAGRADVLALREAAYQARHSEATERALGQRAAETRRWMRELSAQMVPQTDIITMPRDRFEAVRARKSTAAFGAEPREPEAWETRIREALARKVTFDFIETPLPDVVSFLGTLTDASMVLDTDAVRGQAPTVSLRVQNMRLDAALNWVCKLTGLRYTLRDEAIFLARPERIPERTVLRMYDVTDLTMDLTNFKGRPRALATAEGWGTQERDEEEAAARLKADGPEGGRGQRGEALVAFVKSIISPDSWAGDEDAVEKVHDVLGLPREHSETKGQELVDLIGVVVGGRTFVGIKTKE